MDIEKFKRLSDEELREALENRQVMLEWYETHRWEWEGSIIRTKEYRKLHHNQERLKALLRGREEKDG